MLAFQASVTFAKPLPDSDGATLLMLLANVTIPVAGPGEPDAGANVTLICML